MESTAQYIQLRIEAVLDEAIACRLLSACVRPWLLKWLMASITDPVEAPQSLEELIDERIARREAEIDEAFQRCKEANA